MKVALIVGAGSTFSDALGKPIKARPPLDQGFFAAAKTAKATEFKRIAAYMEHNYSIDPANPGDDSLEGILAVIYSDIYNPSAGRASAVQAFRDLLRLINRRMAETTNPLRPNRRKNLYRIVPA